MEVVFLEPRSYLILQPEKHAMICDCCSCYGHGLVAVVVVVTENDTINCVRELCKQCIWCIWHSEDSALWYTCILVIKPMRCTISQIYFDKVLYMFWTDLLSIIRSLNTVYAAIGICRAVILKVGKITCTLWLNCKTCCG